VPQNRRCRPAASAAVRMQITSTKSAKHDANQHLLADRFGDGEGRQFQRSSRPVEEGGSHRHTPSYGTGRRVARWTANHTQHGTSSTTQTTAVTQPSV